MNDKNFNGFSITPIEIISFILNYLLPEELMVVARTNKFFNQLIKEKMWPYKKIIHFGDIGATFENGKLFKDWYRENYFLSSKTHGNFKPLNLPQRYRARLIDMAVKTIIVPISPSAHIAEQQAWANAARPKVCQLDRCPDLKKMVTDKLQCKWSPEQISGWLKQIYPGEPLMHLSLKRFIKASLYRLVAL